MGFWYFLATKLDFLADSTNNNGGTDFGFCRRERKKKMMMMILMMMHSSSSQAARGSRSFCCTCSRRVWIPDSTNNAVMPLKSSFSPSSLPPLPQSSIALLPHTSFMPLPPENSMGFARPSLSLWVLPKTLLSHSLSLSLYLLHGPRKMNDLTAKCEPLGVLFFFFFVWSYLQFLTSTAERIATLHHSQCRKGRQKVQQAIFRCCCCCCCFLVLWSLL